MRGRLIMTSTETSGLGEVLFSGFAIFFFFFSFAPIIIFLWFAITTVKQLKKQTMLLEEIKEKLNR